MPSSAMRYVKVDHCLPLSAIASMLVQLALDPVEERPRVAEVNMKKPRPSVEQEVPSGLTCPECRASLWESRHGELLEFRCRVGHTFSPEGLLAAQSETLERILWSSLNVIEERGTLIDRLAAQAEERDQASVAYQLDGLRKVAAHHSDQIRQMLVNDGDWYSVPAL